MNWKQLQGQSVDGEFQLLEYLGGTEGSATFVAAAPGDAKAVVKLVVAADHDDLLTRWKTAAGLSHPHLLRVFRSGNCRLGGTDLLFVAIEFAEENLEQVIPERALTPDEVRAMVPSVLGALEYLHGKRLVHGNLKPGNVMAVADELKLSSDSVMTFGDPLRTSNAYSAPEAATGVSPATDLWSLGITLTEVLTQKRPTWDAGSTLAQLPDNMPEQFRVMVQRCLIPDPPLRGTIADIRERLNASPSVPVPAQSKPVPAPKPSPLRFAIPAGLAAVAIGAVISLSHKTDTPAQPETTATQTSTSSQTPVVSSPPPAVLTEATDPKPTPEPVRAEPENPQKLEVVMPEKIAANAPPPPLKPQPMAAKAAVSGNDTVVERVLPDIPKKAMRTINGKFRVQVKVRVNRDGDVVGSEFASPGPSKYFADLTMQAARQWKFSRAETSDRAWNLEFEFRRSGISTNPTPIDR